MICPVKGGILKRAIRLKELTPGAEVTYTPTPEYLERTDGSLLIESYLCRVDADGFLMTGNEPGSDETMVFMGDSFVESMYSHERDRFVSVVERGMPGLRCLNASYSGSTTLHILNSLINKVYPVVGPGKSIVIFPPHSDRDHLYVPGAYWNSSALGTTIIPAMDRGNDSIPAGAESFRATLTLCVAAAKELGMRPILATTPFRIAPFESDAVLRRIYRRDAEVYKTSRRRRIEHIETTRRVAALTGADLIDAEAYMAGDPQYFYDELHLNPAGQAHLGQYLTSQLDLMGSSNSSPRRRLLSTG